MVAGRLLGMIVLYWEHLTYCPVLSGTSDLDL